MVEMLWREMSQLKMSQNEILQEGLQQTILHSEMTMGDIAEGKNINEVLVEGGDDT